MALRYCGLVVAALWVGGLSVGVCAVGAEFERDVQPLLEQFCVDCHGPQKQKSDVRLDTLNRDFISGPHAEDWHDVLDVLNRGEMPPEDEKQMTSAERQVIVDWITGQLTHAAEVKRSTGGRGVLRRLTRYEYNQTMKDLLGVDLNYANDLPPEARSSDGFKNNGSSMGMSALQLEYYLAAARMGLSKALVEGEAPKRIRHVTTENQTRNVNKPLKQPHTKNIQPGSSFLARMMEYPEEGPVRVRVKVGVKLPEGASVAGVVGVAPRMRVAMGVRADTENPESLMGEEVDVVEVDGEVGVYEFVGRMENFPLPNKVSGKYPGLLVNVYNVYDDGSGALDKMYLKLNQQEKFLNKPDETQPWLVIESVEFIGSDYEYWPPKHHQAILFEGDGSGGDETGYARRVLERFMGRAFRRPAHADEVDLMLGYFERVRGGDTFVEAMRETLAMVLVSPEFLYLLEPVDGEGARPLTGYEVASRLSYFLWSTMPDDQLIKLAGDGGLLKKRTLAKQVSRMLADDRSQRFENHFADQWLDLDGLDRVAVNPQFYPDFDDRLKIDMRNESRAFFAEVLRNDLSALNFLDSDFAMLNARLAKHYGIEGVKGSGFSRVALKPEDRRGGLLTHGSMLVGNSTGEDSHPIKRAVWLLERLLDDPPAPPPANVPALDSETPGFAELSLKDQLKVHREEEACVSCHLKIDPWGIPLEHYDAAGQYRELARRLSADQRGRARTKLSEGPVDASDVMADGQPIDGVSELKAYLLEEKSDEFARAMVVKVMAYGLGRSLEFTDEALVDKLTKDFERDGYRLDRLISSIVASEAFLTK